MVKYHIRHDHLGRIIPISIPIDQIDYIWIRDRGKNRELLIWLAEFEGLLRNGKVPDVFSSELHGVWWKSVKAVYQSMVDGMTEKGSNNIIGGMRDPFLVRWWPPEKVFVPFKGNQRLCALRACGYIGEVLCRIRSKEG